MIPPAAFAWPGGDGHGLIGIIAGMAFGGCLVLSVRGERCTWLLALGVILIPAALGV